MSHDTYELKESICVFPENFSEAMAFATLGKLEEELFSNKINQLSFENTNWVDISALLMLGVLIGNSSYKRAENIIINLGKYNREKVDSHAAFIVFFVNEGFFNFFSTINYIQFMLNDEVITTDEVQQTVISYSSKLKKCFPPICKPIEDVFVSQKSAYNSTKYIENIIDSINNTVGFAAHGGTIAKERTLQKIRPIIQELLLNIKEHAYFNCEKYQHEKGFFAIFVRFIPSEEDKNTQRLHRDTKNIPLVEKLGKDSGFPRIELYLLDGGIGLRKYAERIKGSTLKNVVQSLGNTLLVGDSEDYRKSMKKEGTSGFQHINNILKHDRDYIRLFTEDGMLSLCADEHYMKQSRLADTIVFGITQGDDLSKQIHSVIAATNLTPPSGTYFYISIPIYNESINFDTPWYTPTLEEKRKIFEAVRKRQQLRKSYKNNNSVFFDRFFHEVNIDYPNEEIIEKLGLYDNKNSNNILIVRLPRHVSKDICMRWLTTITNRKFAFRSVIFADVSPSFAKQLLSIVESKKIIGEKYINIRILTTSWNTASLTSRNQCGQFSHGDNELSAQAFYEGSKPKAIEYIDHLIEQDSKLFWKDIDNVFYHNGKVEVEKDVFVNGYLHFKEAVANKKRRAICKISLKRILHLLDISELRAIEPLAASLTQELALSFRKDIKEHGEKIAIVSVNATAESFEQYKDKNPIVPDILISCFQAPLDKEMEQLAVPVLDWLPNTNITPIMETYKRIEKTPYILPEGKNSIKMPHHVPNTNFLKTTYGCTKNDTYAFMSQLNCLRFQHTKNGSRHDLLSLNTVRAIEGSIFNMSGPYKWLKKKLSQLLKEKNSILIYPSHYANDIILEHVLEDSVQKIGISFFSDTGSMPLRISPSSAQNLKTYCDSLNKGNIVIFDDGVITGRHISFLKEYIHYMFDVGLKNIYTISIVDRTRTPIDFDVVEKKSKYDLRYWRHDVPVYAEEHSCIVCHAIHKLYELAEFVPYLIKKEITDYWIPTWEVKEIYSEWGVSGISPVLLERSLKQDVVFGKEGTKLDNKIDPRNSTILLSYITEITQLIPNKLTGISKGKYFINKAPEITIELVAGQFLLSYYELTLKTKRESLSILFDAILRMHKECNSSLLNKYFSLSSICFLIVEKEIFRSIWENKILHFINNDSNEKWDISLKVFLSILYHHNGQQENFSRSKNNHQNLIDIGVLPTLKSMVEKLLQVIGVRQGEYHNTNLTKDRNYFKNIVDYSDANFCHFYVKNICENFNEYSEILYNTHIYYPDTKAFFNENITKFNETTKNIISELNFSGKKCLMRNKVECREQMCSETSDNTATKKLKELLSNVIYFYDKTTDVIFKKYIFRLSKDENKNFFLKEIIDECLDEIKKDAHFKVCYPTGTWGEDYHIIIPDILKNYIKNIIKNTRNHSEFIENLNDNTDMNMYSFCWTATVISENNNYFLQLNFINKASAKPIPHYSTDEKNCLEEYGGKCFDNYDSTRNEYKVTIIFRALQS